MERHHKFASAITTIVMPPLSMKPGRKATRLDVSKGSKAERSHSTPVSRRASGHAATSPSGPELTHAPQQTTALFDNLVRTDQNRWGSCEPEVFRSLQVLTSLAFWGKLHRQVAG